MSTPESRQSSLAADPTLQAPEKVISIPGRALPQYPAFDEQAWLKAPERVAQPIPGLLPVEITSSEAVQHSKFELSDQLITDVINDKFGLTNLLGSGGTEYASLVMVEPDASDREFKRSSEARADYYLELASFIDDYLGIYVPDNIKPPHQRTLDDTVKAFLKGYRNVLSQSRSTVPGIMKKIGNDTLEAGVKTMAPFSFNCNQSFEYEGIRTAPLLEGRVSETELVHIIKSNMTVTPYGFVHAISNEAMKTWGLERTDDIQRIYLNPQIAAAPGIFRDVIMAGNQKSLPFFGKIDIKKAMGAKNGFAHETHDDPVRTETIVLYARREVSNQLLSIITDMQRVQPEVFEGRSTPVLAQQVAEGVAISDESPVKGESFNSHRADIYGKIKQKIGEEMGYAALTEKLEGEELQWAIRRFRQLHNPMLRDAGINPDNPAFNLR